MIISVLMVVVGLAMILIDKPKKEDEEEKDIADMTYEEFSLYILNHDLIPYINYHDFEVYHLQGRYFYYGCNEWTDTNEFYEVRQVASLLYLDDAQLERGAALPGMFQCDCSGEVVTDIAINYCWFKRVGGPDADTI
jgi:hypothetical protein